MLLVPGGSLDVVYSAEPDMSVGVATMVVPFRNSTLPLGVPANDETCAVKVTGFPDAEGLIDESSEVVVMALVTTCDHVLDVLPVKLLSPLYTALTEWSPTVSARVANVALPPWSGDVPRVVEPLLNVTVPAGVPEPCEVAVAVSVTACPKLEGLSDELSVVVVTEALVLMITPTVPLRLSALTQSFAKTMSGSPSPFRSATTTERGSHPPES